MQFHGRNKSLTCPSLGHLSNVLNISQQMITTTVNFTNPLIRVEYTKINHLYCMSFNISSKLYPPECSLCMEIINYNYSEARIQIYESLKSTSTSILVGKLNLYLFLNKIEILAIKFFIIYIKVYINLID